MLNDLFILYLFLILWSYCVIILNDKYSLIVKSILIESLQHLFISLFKLIELIKFLLFDFFMNLRFFDNSHLIEKNVISKNDCSFNKDLVLESNYAIHILNIWMEFN